MFTDDLCGAGRVARYLSKTCVQRNLSKCDLNTFIAQTPCRQARSTSRDNDEDGYKGTLVITRYKGYQGYRGSDPLDTRDTKIYDGYKCALITTRSPEEWKASLNSCLRRFKSGKNVQQDVSLRICGNEWKCRLCQRSNWEAFWKKYSQNTKELIKGSRSQSREIWTSFLTPHHPRGRRWKRQIWIGFLLLQAWKMGSDLDQLEKGKIETSCFSKMSMTMQGK